MPELDREEVAVVLEECFSELAVELQGASEWEATPATGPIAVDRRLYLAKESGRNRVVSFCEARAASENRNPHTVMEGTVVPGEVGS